MTCLNQKRLTSWAIKKTRGTKNSSPAFHYTFRRSCGARVRRRRKEKHKLVSIDIYNIVFATKGTYHGRTRCVSGPPRAADLSAFTEGCSHAMVGAQLWLWRRTAARKTTTAMAWDCGEISGSGGRCMAQLTMQPGPR